MKLRIPQSASMVVAVVALVAAVGGTSYAAAKIDSADIMNRSINGKDVANDALGGKQINEKKLATVPSATDAATLEGQSAADQKTRWFLLSETGQIEAQSGGFTVLDAYVTNNNVYVDTGEPVTGHGLLASIAIQNQVNVDGADGDAEPNFAGEVSVAACQVPGIVECAPANSKTVNALVVSPRNSDGTATTAGARKRVYVSVTE
jgi:hypothetical protein